MARKISKKFDQKKAVRELARERVGMVKPSRPIIPKPLRKKPKYTHPPSEENPDEI